MSEGIPLLVIVGPTAVGKSEVALCVARRLGGEIVSADSMQVYRHLDIGTAKPTAQERALVTHHLLDVVEPDQEYSVALYQREAEAAIAAAWERGHLPILVGGTGLYVRAVLEGLSFAAAPPHPAVRTRLEALAREQGPGALHALLAQVDPASAERIHPRNLKRAIRALEVYYTTGMPISQLHALDRAGPDRYNALVFGLDMPRELLYRRIDERVEEQLRRGLVAEVAWLLEHGCHERLVSMQGLGYRQLARYLRGESSLEEAVAALKRDTRRFAKRQYTWFRADPRVQWLDVTSLGGEQAVCDHIAAAAAALAANQDTDRNS